MTLTRKEKREIRLEICHHMDLYCKSCQIRGNKKINHNTIYCRKNCLVGALLQDLAFKLIEDEKQLDYSLAKTGTWTEEEDFYLIHHASLYDDEHLARRLSRTLFSVHRRMIHLNLLEKVRN
ncbi:hypothetical protein [Heyndrickxia faecalis]|uniref:hypothetical protein n=1 Tax=Heyndrickxia faecalis TaxID=2824910 RepID=UPI003D22D352